MLDSLLRALVARPQDRRVSKSRRRALRLERLESRQLLSATSGSSDSSATYGPVLRIINGTPTSGWGGVGLVGDTSGYFCSGVLINSQYVLTAGHCATGVANTRGRFQLGSTTYSTSQVAVHPQYNANAEPDSSNDIAIYKLSQAVTSVPSYPIYRGTPQVGQLLTLVGFGEGGTGATGGQGDFGTKRVGTTPIDRVTSRMIWWNFDNESESNTAPGDSGGPAFVNVNGTYYVAGITSGGSNANAGLGDESFDTRVDAYAAWIDSIVGTTTTLPTVSITASDATAAETASGATANPGTFSVSRTGDTSAALTVSYAIGGTATNGSDYTTLASSVVIPAGSASATITVSPIDDSVAESTETVILALASNSTYTLDAAKSSASVSILDNDTSALPMVSITASDATAAETASGATANPGTFTVSRTGDTSAALTVNYAIGGTATNGSDYTTLASSVVIPAGSASATITVSPIDDSVAESTETVILTLGSTAAYTLDATQSSAVVNILDNDFSSLPANDNFANRAAITGTQVTASNVDATRETGEPKNAGVTGGKSLWWTWTAPSSGTVVISTAGSSFDTTLGIYTGTTLSTLKTIASNDDGPTRDAITSQVKFSAVAGTVYQISVDGYGGDSGEILLAVNHYPVPVNDNFANRVAITGTQVTANNLSATRETGEPKNAGVTGGKSVWWTWTAPSSGTFVITTAGSAFDTTLGVYTGTTLSTLRSVASNDDDPTQYVTTSRVSFAATAGKAYQISVDGYAGDSGTIILNVNPSTRSKASAAPWTNNRTTANMTVKPAEVKSGKDTGRAATSTGQIAASNANAKTVAAPARPILSSSYRRQVDALFGQGTSLLSDAVDELFR